MADCYKLIQERKKVKRWDYERLAFEINTKNGTNITGEQCKEVMKRATFPFGAWLTLAIEDVLDIPARDPKTRISFNGGGNNDN